MKNSVGRVGPRKRGTQVIPVKDRPADQLKGPISARASGRSATSREFADLFERIERKDSYLADALEVDVSEQIYLSMKEQGVTNAELGRRLGKSRQYVTRLLQGRTNLTIESLVKIARALGHLIEIRVVPAARSGAKSKTRQLRNGTFASN